MIAADNEFIDAMKQVGFRLRAGITKLTFAYTPRRRTMEVGET